MRTIGFVLGVAGYVFVLHFIFRGNPAVRVLKHLRHHPIDLLMPMPFALSPIGWTMLFPELTVVGATCLLCQLLALSLVLADMRRITLR